MVSARLIGKIAADEAACLFRRARARSMSALPWVRVVDELQRIEAHLEDEGLLDDPIRYHRDPTLPSSVRTIPVRTRWTAYEHISFDSEYEPCGDESSRARWRGYEPCRTMHAWILRCERSEERPWLICIPGYGMGQPTIDIGTFQATTLRQHLNVNVAMPVLPLHGLRSIGWMSGDGYFAGDCLDTLNAQTQAIWDIRRLMRWLQTNGAETFAAYGLSLGGYTAALLATLEPELACVIAGIPASDFIDLGQRHLPTPMQQLACDTGLDWQRVSRVYRVISPLAMEAQVPRERLYIVGATADRIVPLSQVRQLWRHWQRPQAYWYRGSHLSFVAEAGAQFWVQQALAKHLSQTLTHVSKAA